MSFTGKSHLLVENSPTRNYKGSLTLHRKFPFSLKEGNKKNTLNFKGVKLTLILNDRLELNSGRCKSGCCNRARISVFVAIK